VRAVVDTNVWISALLNPAGPPAAIRLALVREQFTVVASEPLLTELAKVLARPRFARRYRVTRADVEELLTLIRERAEIVPVAGAIHLCRDPDDDAVIETALNGGADALVTRDDDLKSVAELAELLGERGVAVMTVRRFLDALAAEATD
jgi:putative PIN family toxin of toxin-antitoxin system